VMTHSRSGQDRIEVALEAIARSAHPIIEWTDYQGRDGRRAFWGFVLLMIGGTGFGRILDLFVFGLVPGDIPIFFAAIIPLILFPAFAALAVRRLHDTGRNGWLLLLGLVPLLGWVTLAYWWSRPSQRAAKRGLGRE
jgi:uncharacterized membrane protein YhaH (DUF805 family)